jgi:porin
VQPSVHYIRNPSAAPAIADALVLGLQFEASHSLLGFWGRREFELLV